jgi:hypothetical protein
VLIKKEIPSPRFGVNLEGTFRNTKTHPQVSYEVRHIGIDPELLVLRRTDAGRVRGSELLGDTVFSEITHP